MRDHGRLLRAAAGSPFGDPQQNYELFEGFGEALYLERRHGPAAAIFRMVATAVPPPRASYENALDWWATALSRAVEGKPAADRRSACRDIGDTMDAVLTRDRSSTVTPYWRAVAGRELGQPERAWDAAVAAWVGAAGTPAFAPTSIG